MKAVLSLALALLLAATLAHAGVPQGPPPPAPEVRLHVEGAALWTVDENGIAVLVVEDLLLSEPLLLAGRPAIRETHVRRIALVYAEHAPEILPLAAEPHRGCVVWQYDRTEGGCFVQRDPDEENLVKDHYLYVRNQPLGWTDPLGEDLWPPPFWYPPVEGVTMPKIDRTSKIGPIGSRMQDAEKAIFEASREYGGNITWAMVTFHWGDLVVFPGTHPEMQTHGDASAQEIRASAHHVPEKKDVVHELAHVYQYQKGYTTKEEIVIREHALSLFVDPYSYGGRKGLRHRVNDPSLNTFEGLSRRGHAEEAAAILEHYIRLRDLGGENAQPWEAMKLDPKTGNWNPESKRFEPEEVVKLFRRLEHFAAGVLWSARQHSHDDVTRKHKPTDKRNW